MKEINSCKNEKISLYRALNSKKSERKRNGLFTFEGEKLFFEAMDAGIEITQIFVSRKFLNNHKNNIENEEKRGAEILILPESILTKMSDTVSPQGVLCIAKVLDKFSSIDKIMNGKHFIFLCGVSDPGNVGTVIRTAEALGFNGIILSESACDMYSPKVVRSAMGSVFRIPVLTVSDEKEFTVTLNNMGVNTYAAAVTGGKDPRNIKLEEPFVIYIGNESHGLPTEIISLCSDVLTLKMNKSVQSFNAAISAGILMWESVRENKYTV